MSKILEHTKEGFVIGVFIPLSPYIMMNSGTQRPLHVNILLLTGGTLLLVPSVVVCTTLGIGVGISKEIGSKL